MGTDARELWLGFETIHAVTYFHPTCLDALTAAGTKGFWMGYFAARMAPLGPVGPEVATAVCFGFSPTRVARALPDAWTYVDPLAICEVRATAAASALRAIVPDLDDLAAGAVGPLEALTSALSIGGRPLAAANFGLPLPADPVARLWQLCTTLREHRGDGHVAAWVAHGLDGAESNVLSCAVLERDPEDLRVSRDWPPEAWAAATDRLVAAGLVTVGDDDRVAPTPAGRDLHATVEQRTDALASAAYAAAVMPAGAQDELTSRLRAMARTIAASGAVRYPNPIGLAEP